MAAVRGGTPWPPCVGWQGLGGCCLLRWRGSHHIPAAAETRPAPAGWACGVGAGVAGEPQTSAGERWRCLARVGAGVGTTGESKDRAKRHGLRKGKKLAGSEQMRRGRDCCEELVRGHFQVPKTFRSRNAVCHG